MRTHIPLPARTQIKRQASHHHSLYLSVMTENIPWSKELRIKREELVVKRIRFSVRRKLSFCALHKLPYLTLVQRGSYLLCWLRSSYTKKWSNRRPRARRFHLRYLVLAILVIACWGQCQPTVNPMLGPSGSALIFLGARFPSVIFLTVDHRNPRLKVISVHVWRTCRLFRLPRCWLVSRHHGSIVLLTFISHSGLNDTANPSTINCPLEDICGFNGVSRQLPPRFTNRWNIISKVSTMAHPISGSGVSSGVRFSHTLAK